MKNVTKFNKGNENLNDLLSSQKIFNNHFGLGFFKDKYEKYFHVHVYKNNNHNSYNSFIKKNYNLSTNR